MPRDIPTYTVCAGPGVARSSKQIGGLAGTLVSAFFANKALTVGAFLAVLIALTLMQNPLAWAVFGAAIITALVEFKNWYYHGRLLCIRDRDCAIGTVIAEPTAAFDGDRKLNLLLAPYSQRECVETLLDHLTVNEAMLIDNSNFNDPPFHTTAPPLPVAAQRENDFDVLRKYLHNPDSPESTLQSHDPDDEDADANMYRQTLIGVIDRLMSNPNKNFYNRYHRKDSAHIPQGTPLWDTIPEDFDATVNWQAPNAQSSRTHFNPYAQKTETLNPMFRFDNDHVVPYLHCEIEGYYIALLIDNIILAFSAWLAAVLAFSWLGPLAPVVATLIALLIFLFKWLIDELTGNDGDAEEPDIDWDTPGAPEGDVNQRQGDVVVTYGNWIMDSEHYQYFEIHPVRAYYVIARNSLGTEPVLVNGNMDQEEFGHENFDPAQITAGRAEEMCRVVTVAEEDTPRDTIEQDAAGALSHGLTTYYAGGGAQEIR